MFCSNCGKPVSPGANFCTDCGSVIGHGGSTAHTPGIAIGIASILAAGGGKPNLVSWAGIGSFLWAAVMVLLVLLQLVLAKIKGDSDIATLGYWNLLVVAV